MDHFELSESPVEIRGRPRQRDTIFDRHPERLEATQRLSDSSILDAEVADEDWAAERETDEVKPSCIDERYETRESLGRGGMGSVHIAWDRHIGREVAVKLMHSKFVGVRAHEKRFVREACLQGRLVHPSIVPVYDVRVAKSGQHYFTMKRIEGVSLRRAIDGRRDGSLDDDDRFSTHALLEALKRVCLAIDFAHERGVVHRDLKPTNIMLASQEETYVLDWGLAKYLGDGDDSTGQLMLENAAATEGGLLLGTLGYMAPEQIGGEPESSWTLVDIYALGSILFEILTQTPLNRIGNGEDIIKTTLSGVDARCSVRCPERNVPAELEAICVKATSFVPNDRFQSAREMADALEHYLAQRRTRRHLADIASVTSVRAKADIEAALSAQPSEQDERRRIALWSAARALALDPRRSDLAQSLQLLLETTPRSLPDSAREKVERARRWASSQSELWASALYVITLAGVPILARMGVRDWRVVTLSVVALSLLAASSFFSSRSPKPPAWAVYFRASLGVLACLLSATLFGPLFLMPSLLVANAAGFALRPDPRLRSFTLAISMLALVALPGLAWAGLIESPYLFREGMLCILPRAVDFSPAVTSSAVTLGHAGLLYATVAYVGTVRRQLKASEDELHLRNWQLKQMIPRRRGA